MNFKLKSTWAKHWKWLGNVHKLSKNVFIPFSNNEKKTNRWIAFLNGFNLLFGGYFLYYSLLPTIPETGFSILYIVTHVLLQRVVIDSSMLVFLGLGVAPAVFSIFFFAITLVRRARDRRKNGRLRAHNRVRKFVRTIVERPSKVELNNIHADDDRTPSEDKIKRKGLAEFEAIGEVSVNVERNGRATYSFPEVDRIQREMASFRQSIDPERYAVGNVVFDSGSEQT